MAPLNQLGGARSQMGGARSQLGGAGSQDKYSGAKADAGFQSAIDE